MAAAGPDHHVPVLLQDDIGAVVKVQDGYSVELGGCTARLRYRVRVDEVNLQPPTEITVRGGEAFCGLLQFSKERLLSG